LKFQQQNKNFLVQLKNIKISNGHNFRHTGPISKMPDKTKRRAMFPFEKHEFLRAGGLHRRAGQ